MRLLIWSTAGDMRWQWRDWSSADVGGHVRAYGYGLLSGVRRTVRVFARRPTHAMKLHEWRHRVWVLLWQLPAANLFRGR